VHASRVPFSQRADPVAECDFAKVATGFDWTRDRIRCSWARAVSVAPAPPITIVTVGPVIAVRPIVAVIGPVVAPVRPITIIPKSNCRVNLGSYESNTLPLLR
jgi:hypothetical protein